jgi:hypothetical protein
MLLGEDVVGNNFVHGILLVAVQLFDFGVAEVVFVFPAT